MTAAKNAGSVAVITDIHVNLPALQAALARIDERGIRIYCGGDLVGYGPHPLGDRAATSRTAAARTSRRTTEQHDEHPVEFDARLIRT